MYVEERDVVCIKVLNQNFPGQTKEKNEELQSGQWATGPRIESSVSVTNSGIANIYAATFGPLRSTTILTSP